MRHSPFQQIQENKKFSAAHGASGITSNLFLIGNDIGGTGSGQVVPHEIAKMCFKFRSTLGSGTLRFNWRADNIDFLDLLNTKSWLLDESRCRVFYFQDNCLFFQLSRIRRIVLYFLR